MFSFTNIITLSCANRSQHASPTEGNHTAPRNCSIRKMQKKGCAMMVSYLGLLDNSLELAP